METQNNTQSKFIRVNDRIINKDFIRWIHFEKCYHVCSKLDGCSPQNTIEVCKNDIGFEAIEKLFNESSK